MKRHVVTVDVEDGNAVLRWIYDDRLKTLAEIGSAETRRASHVEPAGREWQADLSPTGGPVLNPTPTRQESLDAEIAWLEEHYL